MRADGNDIGTSPFDENIRFQHKVWIAERIGWSLFAVILLAAVLGAFGTGVFAEVNVTPADRTFSLRYLRFARMQAPVTLRIALAAQGSAEEPTIVWISSDYLQEFTVNSIIPHPENVVLGDGRIEYLFSRRAGSGRSVVKFSLEAESAGRAVGAVGVGNGSMVRIRQFFYP